MNWKEISAIILGSSAVTVFVKTIVDGFFNRRKVMAEAKNIEANTGKTYGDQAKSFAEAVKISVEAKVMAEGIWEKYSVKLELQISQLKEELRLERVECIENMNNLQKQINELKRTK